MMKTLLVAVCLFGTMLGGFARAEDQFPTEETTVAPQAAEDAAASQSEDTPATDVKTIVEPGKTSVPETEPKHHDDKIKVMLVRYRPGAHLLFNKPSAKHKTIVSVDRPYTVQISSYLTSSEAEAKVTELTKIKVPQVWQFSATVDGKTRYRVCSGHYKTWKEAHAAQASIASRTGVKGAFVQKAPSRMTAQNDCSTENTPICGGGD